MTEIKNELIEYANRKVKKTSRISEVEEQEKGVEKTSTQKIKSFKYTVWPGKKKKAGAG